jgi:hypothetical protein
VDTRSGVGIPAGRVPNGGTLTITPGTHIELPATATAVYASIVVLDQAGNGWVSTYATGSPPAGSYSLDFDSGGPDAAPTTIPLNSAGQFDLRVAAGGPADVLVDIEGYFDSSVAGGAFTPAQSRRYDSRQSPNTALAAGATRSITIGGSGNIPAQTGAVALDVTTASATGTTNGYLTFWTPGQTEPAPSSMNFDSANFFRASLILVTPDSSGHINIHNHSSGPINIVLDAEGWSSSVP